jgi:hypothetical protein
MNSIAKGSQFWIGCLAILTASISSGCGSHPADRSFDLASKWDGSLHERIPDEVRDALLHGKNVELFSLDPAHREEGYPKEFYRRRVLGKTSVSETDTRRLLASVNDAVAEEAKPKATSGAACFDPRHAIRVQHDGKMFYVLICFECHHVYVYVNDELRDKLYFPISDSPLVAFNDVLKKAGLPLAKPAQLSE